MSDEFSPGGDIDLSDVIDDGGQSLGHLCVVHKLVSEFVSAVLLVKVENAKGNEAARAPGPMIEDLAAKAGDAIMGRNHEYDAQQWQNPSRLGGRLKALIPEFCKRYVDPGKALFMWLATQVLRASKALGEGTSEEVVKEQLGKVADDVVARILGVR